MGIELTLQRADVLDGAGDASLSITFGWSSKLVLTLIVVPSRLMEQGCQIRGTRSRMAAVKAVCVMGRVETGMIMSSSRGIDPGGASHRHRTCSLTGKRMCDDVQGSRTALRAGEVQSRLLLLI